jgi:hypothetical protein
MPDRPGALGAVASRIGAVRADVVGIEILTRADGRAMDEIAVEIDRDLLPLLLSEIAEVDGVVVEEVRMLPGPIRDRRLDAYQTAAALLEARTPDELLSSLAARVSNELDSGWVAILDTESELLLANEGRPPAAEWLANSLRRSETAKQSRSETAKKNSTGPNAGSITPDSINSGSISEDLIWVVLTRFDAVLSAGRPGWPFSDHDRIKLDAMARLADARWSELSGKGIQPRTGETRLIRP